MLDIYLLLIFMVIGAIVAIEISDLLSSVIVLGAVGLALCMSFIVLKAPDVAITQLVVEVLCLIILIRATLKKDLPFSTSGRWWVNTLITVAFVAMFLFVSFKAVSELPRFGGPLMTVSQGYINEGFSQTGAANMVSAITLDYRAYDTLGEATLLFTAVIGVLAILRRRGKRKEHEEDNDE